MAYGDIGTNQAWFNANKKRNKLIAGTIVGLAMLGGAYLLGDKYLNEYKPLKSQVHTNTQVSQDAYKLGQQNQGAIANLGNDVQDNTGKIRGLTGRVTGNESDISTLYNTARRNTSDISDLTTAVTGNEQDIANLKTGQSKLEQRVSQTEKGIRRFNLNFDRTGPNEEAMYLPVQNTLVDLNNNKTTSAYDWAMESLRHIEQYGNQAKIGEFDDVVGFYQAMNEDANLEIEPATIDELKKRYK
ncbi:MAG: hypothetical protein ACOC2U_04415 [bacterium]